MHTSVRIAHLSVFRRSAGVQRQLGFEQRAARKLGDLVQWEVHTFLAEQPYKDEGWGHPTFVAPLRIPQWLRIWVARWALFRWLQQHRHSFDFILLRWPGVGPLTVLYQDLFKSVLTIHHTKEMEELELLGMKARAVLEGGLSPLLLRRVRAIVGVTEEIIQYELCRIGRRKKGFLYPNGIDYDTTPLVRRRSHNQEVVFIMIASHFFPWHGLDLIYRLLHEYPGKFVFHVIGYVSPSLREQIAQDKRFRMHGYLDALQIARLIAESDVGISSMALFRKRMEEASPLKAREYLASGLPVLGGYRDAGLPKEFPYYMRFDLRKRVEPWEIIEAAVYLRRYKPGEIRSESRPFIEKVRLMKRLLVELQTLL